MSDLSALWAVREHPDGYEVDTIPTAHGAVFGAYLLFQQVLVAERATSGKRVLSLQTAFANGGDSTLPLTVRIERLQDGRSFSFLTLTFAQGDLVVSRAEVLLTADEPDFLRHQATPPVPTAHDAAWVPRGPALYPGTARRREPAGLDGLEVAFDLADAVDDPSVARGLVALASEPEVLTAFLEFGAVGDAPPGRMPANVLTQNLAFLEPPDPTAGLVLRVVPAYAGRGRAHGSGSVLDPAGRLLATFTTTGVLRAPRRP